MGQTTTRRGNDAYFQNFHFIATLKGQLAQRYKRQHFVLMHETNLSLSYETNNRVKARIRISKDPRKGSSTHDHPQLENGQYVGW